jgi:hypothetical protein
MSITVTEFCLNEEERVRRFAERNAGADPRVETLARIAKEIKALIPPTPERYR